MDENQSVSLNELIASLRYVRAHLYSAQAQFNYGDDTIIVRHVYDAYRRIAELTKTIELHGVRK